MALAAFLLLLLASSAVHTTFENLSRQVRDGGAHWAGCFAGWRSAAVA
jgi:hypothetical protein